MGHGCPPPDGCSTKAIRPSLSIDVCSSIGGDMFGGDADREYPLAARASTTPPPPRRVFSLVDELRPQLQGHGRVRHRARSPRLWASTSKVGSLTPGKEADLILIRTDTLSADPDEQPLVAVVYAAHPGNVDTVLVKGHVVKRDGRAHRRRRRQVSVVSPSRRATTCSPRPPRGSDHRRREDRWRLDPRARSGLSQFSPRLPPRGAGRPFLGARRVGARSP